MRRTRRRRSRARRSRRGIPKLPSEQLEQESFKEDCGGLELRQGLTSGPSSWLGQISVERPTLEDYRAYLSSRDTCAPSSSNLSSRESSAGSVGLNHRAYLSSRDTGVLSSSNVSSRESSAGSVGLGDLYAGADKEPLRTLTSPSVTTTSTVGQAEIEDETDSEDTEAGAKEKRVTRPIVYQNSPRKRRGRSTYHVDKSHSLGTRHGARLGLPQGFSDRQYLHGLEQKAKHAGDRVASAYLQRYNYNRRRKVEDDLFADFEAFGDTAMGDGEWSTDEEVCKVPAKPWSAAESKYQRISKGKRLWLKALRLIKSRRGKTAPAVRPPECKADITIDENGKERLVLTTTPENEEKVQLERKAGFLWLRRNDASKRHIEMPHPSVTMEQVLRWYTDQELRKDDQILRATENAAFRALKAAEEEALLRRWLALPDPTIAAADVSPEILSLELKLAFSISKVREMIKGSHPCYIIRSSTDQQFIDLWSSGELKAARDYFLDLEITTAVQDPVVLAKAANCGLTPHYEDKTSMKRKERQRWRDFCKWYFQEGVVRLQHLQEQSRCLEACLESCWFLSQKELEKFGKVRTHREIKRLHRRRHKTVIEVVDTIVEDMNGLPYRLHLEAFKSLPQGIQAESELHNEFGDAVKWTTLDIETKNLELQMALQSRIGRFLIRQDGFNLEELSRTNPLVWEVYSLWYGAQSRLRRYLLRREIVSFVQCRQLEVDNETAKARVSLLMDLQPAITQRLQAAWADYLDFEGTEPPLEHECVYGSVKLKTKLVPPGWKLKDGIGLAEEILETATTGFQKKVNAVLLDLFRKNQSVWRRYSYKYATGDLEEGETIEISESCALEELEQLQMQAALDLFSIMAKLDVLWKKLNEMVALLGLIERLLIGAEKLPEPAQASTRLLYFSLGSLLLWKKALESTGIGALDHLVCGFKDLKARLPSDIESIPTQDYSFHCCTECTKSVVRDLEAIGIQCSIEHFQSLARKSPTLQKEHLNPSEIGHTLSCLDYVSMRESEQLRDLVKRYTSNPGYRQATLQLQLKVFHNFVAEQDQREEDTLGVCVYDPAGCFRSPPVDKWGLRKLRLAQMLLWYTTEELQMDDKEMERAELMGRMLFEAELERQRQLQTQIEEETESGESSTEESSSSAYSDSGTESGSSYAFTSPIDMEASLEYSVTAALQMASLGDTGVGESTEETREEAEKRRKAELMAMRREERSHRRWIVETRRRRLMQDAELALNSQVAQQKQEEQERRNDRDGMTVEERREFENTCMATEDKECVLRWKEIDEELERRKEWECYIREVSHEQMMEEDNNAYLVEERLKEVRQIDCFQELRARNSMESEDLHSYLCRPIWERERQQKTVWNSLMSAAYAPFEPYYANPKSDAEIFSELDYGPPLEFYPRGVLPVRRRIDVHLSNKFQQVLGVPSNFRIPPLGRKPRRRRLPSCEHLTEPLPEQWPHVHEDWRDEEERRSLPMLIRASATGQVYQGLPSRARQIFKAE